MRATRAMGLTTAVVGLLLLSSPAEAQSTWTDKTKIEFSAPVEVPGMTLPAGTYTFKIMDSATSRRVVEIWNEDQTKLHTMALAIPARRLEPKGDIYVTFARTEPGTPPAVKQWFYPGDLTGHEFIYPEQQASKIARTTKQLVLSSDADPKNMESRANAKVEWIDESGQKRPWTESNAGNQGDQRGNMNQSATQNQAGQQNRGAQQSAAATPSQPQAAEPRSGASPKDWGEKPPQVKAAPSDRAEGSGKVALHGLDGEEEARHHLEHAERVLNQMMSASANRQSGAVGTAGGDDTVTVSRAMLKDVQDSIQKASKILKD